MRSSSSGLKIGIGVAVAVLAVVAVVRVTRQAPDSASTPEGGAPRQPMKPSDRVQQRLQQIQASRSGGMAVGGSHEGSDRFSVHTRLRRTPQALDAARGVPEAPDPGQEAVEEATP